MGTFIKKEKFVVDLGTRMKRYEATYKNFLIPHVPTIIRCDGKAFHTYTKKHFREPFSSVLHQAMVNSMWFLMSEVMYGSVLGYTQSDEISILLKDWPDINTEQWFGGNVQKIVSVSASAVTGKFNSLVEQTSNNYSIAMFDARVFQLPSEEVVNYFVWRQQDAIRNSVQRLGRIYFSQKQLHGLNNTQVKEKLLSEADIKWENLNFWEKHGSCVFKDEDGQFVFDPSMPVLTTNRAYIENLL